MGQIQVFLKLVNPIKSYEQKREEKFSLGENQADIGKVENHTT